MILFDEKEYAEKLLNKKDCKYIRSMNIFILARYYKYLGLRKRQIEDKLIEYCKRINPFFNEIKGWKLIKDSFNATKRFKLRLSAPVRITKKEIDTIFSVNNYIIEKILFVMLVVSRYFKENKTYIRINQEKLDKNKDRYFFNYHFPQAFPLAHVSMKKPERDILFHELFLRGFINITMSGSIELLYADNNDNSEIYLIVDNLNNIIKYLPYRCTSCGKPMLRKGRNHKLCDECWSKKHGLCV